MAGTFIALPRFHRTAPFWAVIVGLAAALNHAAAEESVRRVAVVDDRTPVRSGSMSIDFLDAGEVLNVLNTREGWLLVSRGRPGWIDGAAVLSLDEASNALNSIAAQRPNDGRARAARATLWMETGHLDEAIAEASEAIRLSPEVVSAWLTRSAAQRQKKDFAAALIDAQSAIQLAPKSPYPHLAVGDIWRDQRQPEQAAIEYAAAVELDHKHCTANLRLAQARLASLSPPQWIKAGEDFTKTIQLAEHDPTCRRAARLGRGEAWNKEGRLRAALEQYSELIAENRKDVDALAGRGMVHANLYRYERAIPDLDEAIELEPKNAHLWVVRATIRMKQFNFRGAIHDLDEAVKLDPNSSEAYLVRGQTLAKQKKWAPAIAALTQAIALDAGSAAAYLARADAYQAKGDTELAKTDRAQVGKLNPQLLMPPSGKELMEKERRQMMEKFANSAGQSG
jgi:tetratricopeptide (TPR) repeat protein